MRCCRLTKLHPPVLPSDSLINCVTTPVDGPHLCPEGLEGLTTLADTHDTPQCRSMPAVTSVSCLTSSVVDLTAGRTAERAPHLLGQEIPPQP
jgi:hypothetical protein